MNKTYDLRRGWLNVGKHPPIHMFAGKIWKTKNGLPIMIPDSWYENASPKLKLEMPILPEGIPYTKIGSK